MRRPPWLASRLLRLLLPEQERDFVVGDLEEGFQVRASQVGRWRAGLWMWGEVLRSVWPFVTYPGRWEGMTMVGWKQDLRGAFRVFGRSPGFAAVVVLTLGIGVGGASAVYSVVRGVLLEPMPFEDPDRVVMLWGQAPEYPRVPLTVGDHNVLVHEAKALQAVSAAWSSNALLLGDAEPEQVGLGWVTPNYFKVLGIRPALGRALTATDQGAILISHALWVRRYGSDPEVVGSVVQLGGEAFEIAGVLPEDRDANLTTFGGGRARHEVWRLQPPEWTQGEDRSVAWLRSTARLRDGVTLVQAQAQIDALFEVVNQSVGERDGGADLRINLIPVRQDLVGGLARTLWILLAAVFGVLLIAASNVAHLMLARGEGRGGEVAVRTALGGSRARLVRQMLVEGAVLAVAGGVVGLAFAWIGVEGLFRFAPTTLPRLDRVTLDWQVFGFALGATGLAAVVFALVPAVRSSKADLSGVLGERHSTADARRQGLSRALVVAEVAVSLALLTSTGLLLRSLGGLASVELGFETRGVVTFSMESPFWGDTAEEAAATMSSYVDALRVVPGVTQAGFTNRIPLGGGLFTGTMRSEEMVGADQAAFETAVRYITPGYLETMGGRLLAGRGFRSEDGLATALVDEIAAERMWPGMNPVGRRVQTSAIGEEPTWAEVVGVVAAMKHHGVAEPAVETLFLPMLARGHQQNFHYVAVRVAGEPSEYVERLRAAVREVQADAVIARVQTMEDLFEENVASTRFATFVLTLFGLTALLLAGVGLHGVMAFSVRQRSREIGIRVALGAEHGEILVRAVRSGAALVLGGIGLGILLSLVSGRALQSLLYDVQPSDTLTLLASALVMLAVGLLGAYLPARFVLSVDPAVTLRGD